MFQTRLIPSKRALPLLGLAALATVGYTHGLSLAKTKPVALRQAESAPQANSGLRLASLSSDNLPDSPANTGRFPATDARLKARLAPVPGARPGSYEEMSRVLTRDQFDALSPALRKLARTTLINRRQGLAIPIYCFAPGTPVKQQRAFAALGASLDPKGEFRADGRWTETATDGSVARNQPFTLTWNIVPDGTLEGTAASDLQAFVTKTYGSVEAFRALYRKMFATYQNLTGITFVEVDYDDKADYGSPGVLGTRADIRIGGHTIDGNSNVLAYNYFPNSGDCIIDTADNFYAGDAGGEGTQNVFAHEMGHGLGFAHVCPIDRTKLMEPTVASGYIGPQFDDILAAQFNYGDQYEKGKRNNTPATGSDLGTIKLGTTTDLRNVSLNVDDVDFYKITPDSDQRSVTLKLQPAGKPYLEGAQNADASCSDGTLFDPSIVRTLNLDIVNASGTVLASSPVAAAGAGKGITDFDLTGAGPYYARVSSTNPSENKVQAYTLSIKIGPRKNRPPSIDNLRFNPTRPSGDEVLSVLFDLSDPDENDTVTASTEWKRNGEVISVPSDSIDLREEGAGDLGDVFEVTVNAVDSSGSTATKTIKVVLRPKNVAPVLNDTRFSVLENRVLTAQLKATDENSKDKNALDSTANMEPLTYKVFKKATNGTVVLAEDGQFTYTPNTNFNGTDSFVARVSDPDGLTDDATITIAVTPVNNSPILTDDVINTNEDVELKIAAATLLKNDNNGEAKGETDALSITKVTPAKNFPGKLVLDVEAQVITFTPTLNWNGETIFNYTVTDSGRRSSTAKVTLKVKAVNDAPVAQALSMNAVSATPTSIKLVGTDAEGDVAGFRIQTKPANGTAKLVEDEGVWTIIYKSKTGFIGTDSLTYVARDGYLSSVPAKITINVTANSAPVIVSLAPNRGRFDEESTVIFTQKVRDSNGAGHIDAASLLISSVSNRPEGKKGVALWFDAVNNQFTITTDDGKSTYTPLALGRSLYNSQVSVLLRKEDVTRSADGTLTLKWRVTFKKGFVGTKTLFSRVEDLGGASAGYNVSGSIIIGSATPTTSAATSADNS
jgi:hypothetical protein